MVDPINIVDAFEHTEKLLNANQVDAASAYLSALHPADSAEVIAMLEPESQALVAARLACLGFLWLGPLSLHLHATLQPEEVAPALRRGVGWAYAGTLTRRAYQSS